MSLTTLVVKLNHNPFALLSSSCWGFNLCGGLEEGTLFSLYVLEKSFLVVIAIFLLSTFLAIMKAFSSDMVQRDIPHVECYLSRFQ